MASLSFLLVSTVLCLAVYSSLSPISSAVAGKPCEREAIRKCNYEFKEVFAPINASAGLRIWENAYCSALQTFMNCLDRSLENCTGSTWLSEYSFVVLEHGVMDKKCGMCPRHQFGNLENASNARRKPYYVGSDVCLSCARRVHHKCVWRFLRKIMVDPNMCNDIQEFIACYKEEGDRRKKRCAATKIVRKFSHLCQKQGERMLIMDKIHPGLMC